MKKDPQFVTAERLKLSFPWLTEPQCCGIAAIANQQVGEVIEAAPTMHGFKSIGGKWNMTEEHGRLYTSNTHTAKLVCIEVME